MIERAGPTVLVVAACLGLAVSNAYRSPASDLVVLLLGRRCSARRRCRALAVGRACRRSSLVLALVGWWWGSARLEALDRSVLASHVGRSSEAEVVITGPARRTRFTLRMPADARRFASERVGEPVLLELPLGRSPPQGSILALRTTVVAPRSSESGFDERGWLARRGVHVILRGRDWRVVGRRGGIGGLSDRLRGHVARSIAPGLEGERRAVLAGNRARRGRGSLRGAAGQLQGGRPLSPARRVRAERRLPRRRRARARLSPRDLAAARRSGGDRRDRRVRARRRLAAVGGSRRRRRRARLARLAGLAPTRSLALHGARAPPSSSRGRRRRSSSRVSSSRSRPWRRSSCSSRV